MSTFTPLDLPGAAKNMDGSVSADCPVCHRAGALWAPGLEHPAACTAGCDPGRVQDALVAVYDDVDAHAPVRFHQHQGGRNGHAGGNNSTKMTAVPVAEPPGPHLVCLSDVKAEQVQWLWPGWIPSGKLTLMDGDPGLGKSTLSLDIAARSSVGEAMPGDDLPSGQPSSSLLLTAEDGLADTVQPRLLAAGADIKRVFHLGSVPRPLGDGQGFTSAPPTLPDDIPAIEEIVRREEIRLVIIDPLMAFLSGQVNSNRDQDVRRALAPLAAMAEATGTAVVVLRHLNKAGGNSALYRGGGSIGISGAARSVLLVAKHPDDENRRVLAHVKCNLAPLAPALSFHLRSDEEGAAARIAWEGTADLSADALLASQVPTGEASALDEATDFLRELLSEGAVRADAAFRDAKQNGISEASLRRAKKRLDVICRPDGSPSQGGKWVWRLPDTPDQND